MQTTLERAKGYQQAKEYIYSLKGIAHTYALQTYGAMKEGMPWPETPKGLGMCRAQRIITKLGDLLDWWQ